MANVAIRVLVVDDFEPFRAFVCSMLREHPEFQVIGEAADGLAAVQKAEQLQPDLILLDIGLPELNGIEAARRIRKLSPESKILFVSQESSAAVAQAALGTGASGYVVKADAVTELLAAVNAILQDEPYIESRFAGRVCSEGSEVRTPDEVVRNQVFAPLRQNTEIAHRHEAGFFSADRYLLDEVTRFVEAALTAGCAAIVVATESHRKSLRQTLELEAHGFDIGTAIEQGRYTALDAADTLSAIMRHGMPDAVLFLKLLGNLIVAAAAASKGKQGRVAVFGECVHLLWAQGNAEAAIQLEKLCNQLAERYEVDILCSYSLGSVQGGMDARVFQEICAEHSAVHVR
jgi:DNA-binding NarL/FixJ family response regulator